MEFQSTLPARGATRQKRRWFAPPRFQSTLPARGATLTRLTRAGGTGHFNPRSPHGERHCRPAATDVLAGISIHAPRTGSDRAAGQPRPLGRISIHAPRTGSDAYTFRCWLLRLDFNPRSPHGERPRRLRRATPPSGFQSTLPARGATRNSPPDEGRTRFQSTLPARGATRGRVQDTSKRSFQSTLPARGATLEAQRPRIVSVISIHAPRTGSDFIACSAFASSLLFQSTLPARGATNALPGIPVTSGDFNPRSPHGERRNFARVCYLHKKFQSTLPARGAT